LKRLVLSNMEREKEKSKGENTNNAIVGVDG
jgi:hypothetical protein